MGILDSKSKAILVESMRNSICGALMESTDMSAADASNRMKYVRENATYEQLLNITMNPDRETNYLPDHVLEGAVAILHSACMTGRKYIGQNAIAEGAMKLQKATGCVITESMLDAALNAVEHGNGLKIIGGILKEAAVIQEAEAKEAGKIKKTLNAVADVAKKAVKKLGDASGVADKAEAKKAMAKVEKAKELGGKAMSKDTKAKAAEIVNKNLKKAKALNKSGNKKLAVTGAIAAGTVGLAGLGLAAAKKAKKGKKSVKESVVAESLAGAVVDQAVYSLPFAKKRMIDQIKIAIIKTKKAKDVSEIAKVLDELNYKLKWFRRTGLRSQSREIQMAFDEKNSSFWKRLFSVAHRAAYELEKANGDVEVAKHNVLKDLRVIKVMISILAPGSAVASWYGNKNLDTKTGMGD